MKSRRDVLRDGAVVAAGLAATTATAAAQDAAPTKTDAPAPGPLTGFPTPPMVRKGDMVYRTLGRTGEQVSLIGLGGFHIGKQADEAESIRLIRAALDKGITFLDNCWDYNNGDSERRMGRALQEARARDRVFLMTKIDGRTRKAAARQLDESLLRLRTDRIDLVQFHEIIRMEDPDRVFAKNGALEAVLAAKQAGKVRYIGFTGHKDPLVHRRMLEVAAKNGFRFDAVQMPVNVMDAHFRSFTHQVLPTLVREQIGVLGMKTFGDPFILRWAQQSGLVQPVELLHYGMTLPTSVVITGIDSTQILDQAVEAARTFKPMTAEQVAALLAKTRVAALTGEHEKFKTGTRFDGTAQHPQWLEA
jgi:aryl-alcohol dehydrogenase-like predicted oxidoreductase